MYRSPYIIRVIKSRRLRWAGYLARIEKGRSGFKILIGKSIGKISLVGPRHRSEDNIRMDLKKIDINTRNLIDSAQDRDHCRALVIELLSLRDP